MHIFKENGIHHKDSLLADYTRLKVISQSKNKSLNQKVRVLKIKHFKL